MQKARREELNGFVKNGTFATMTREDVPKDTRIFGSRFVDLIKQIGDQERKKSRLVEENYSDFGTAEIATKAPTIQRLS